MSGEGIHRVVFAVLILAILPRVLRAEASRSDVVPLSIVVGEQKVISSDGVRSYSEGTPGIVDVRLTRDGSEFVLVGQRPGSTSLLFILTSGIERHYRLEVVAAAGTPAGLAGGPSTRVEQRDNIRLDLYFVQLSRSNHLQIGVAWPGSVGGGAFSASYDVLGGGFDSATAVVADQALPRLDMAQAAGWAKIMRQAAVITANGTEATFSGGGEVNIPILGGLAAEIRTIQFGSTVKVLPRYDRETGRVELVLAAHVSDLTDDSGTGAPGRTTADLQTVVNLELGQSLVLGGLQSRSRMQSRSGLPGLSQIPILGVLFGSHADRSQDTENVVLIVPTVVDAVSVQARDRIRDALEIYEEYTGDLDEVELVARARSPSRGGLKP